MRELIEELALMNADHSGVTDRSADRMLSQLEQGAANDARVERRRADEDADVRGERFDGME